MKNIPVLIVDYICNKNLVIYEGKKEHKNACSLIVLKVTCSVHRDVDLRSYCPALFDCDFDSAAMIKMTMLLLPPFPDLL